MTAFLKKHFKGGVTRISKESERKFFFYASVGFVIFYLVQRILGNI